MQDVPDLSLALETARAAVEAAARVCLRHFRGPLEIERKPDRSPVTQADREAETAILEEIRRRFPRHSVLSEESGASGEGSASRWIVDPLDGTRGFTRGGSHWGPLVALEHRGDVVVGAMTLPALGETYWAARGQGCFRDGERLRVSEVSDWTEATLSVGELRNLLAPPHGAAVASLIATAASTRCYGDLAGCAMLLSGRAEAWLEAGVKVWDVAALAILVKEAGGRFTDFDGGAAIDAGRAVATNGELLHGHVLASLRRDPA